MEVAIGNVVLPVSVGLAQAHPPSKPQAMRKQLSDALGPVTVHPTPSGVGPRTHDTAHLRIVYLVKRDLDGSKRACQRLPVIVKETSNKLW